MDGQHSARVNIDDRDWIRFRIRAMRRQRSIADYLGDLVRAELATRDAVEADGAASEDAHAASAPRARSGRHIRVNDRTG